MMQGSPLPACTTHATPTHPPPTTHTTLQGGHVHLDPGSAQAINMDELREHWVMHVRGSRRRVRQGGGEAGRLLAAEFAKKVHVSMYADGPTRVLCFSDERRAASSEDESSGLNLSYRLMQVGAGCVVVHGGGCMWGHVGTRLRADAGEGCGC
jgi:hypothetical protein